jgi:type I restriction enzyme S subunit
MQVAKFAEFVRHRKEFILIDDFEVYKRARVQLHWKGIVVRDHVKGIAVKTKAQQVARTGELLVAEIDAKVGGIGIVPPEVNDAIVSSHYFLFQIDEQKCLLSWLDYYIRSGALADQIAARGSTNYAAIRPHHILECEMPMPPLDEQRRIVARIEELSAKIEEAHCVREQTTRETKALVGAKLGQVFSQLATEYNVNSLGSLTSHIVDGPHQTPRYLSEGIPFVTVKNMVTGRLNFDHINYVSEADHRLFSKRCSAERGDILYSKDGATRGRPCLVDTDREFSFFVSVALIKPLRDRLDSAYLVHLLNSNWIKDRMKDKSRGDMIPHIVLREIKAFPVPLLPLDEQRRIVAYLDAIHAKVDTVKKLQEETAQELDALMPSILSRAFSGAL